MRRILLAMAVAISAAADSPARGETSSWISQGGAGQDGRQTKPAGAKATGKQATPARRAKAESHVVAPIYRPKGGPEAAGAIPRIPPPSVDGEHTSTVAKTPSADDNAAYEAFDQGKYLTALELAAKAAEHGDPEAHTLIGRIYAEGDGTARNPPLAAQWYARGVELNDAQAMFAYGVILAEGVGVAKNRQAAAEMFEAAAVRHHPLANYNLALLFLAGDGKPENPYRGFLHMRYAAEAGVVLAQYGLGTLYATGTGVDANAFEAARWIGKAAVAGYAEAQLDFGVLLFEGRGVPADPQRGAHMFRQAAEQGLPVAQNRLARCYAQGAGVTTNLGEAARWHLIAKAGGIEDKSLEELLARLSKADRAKAESAAEAWREKVPQQLE